MTRLASVALRSARIAAITMRSGALQRVALPTASAVPRAAPVMLSRGTSTDLVTRANLPSFCDGARRECVP